ncbi:hypothetical protein M885DRAFT_112370 [Pelagophyceae sp. CCMP2097]|nr:hypothetical protein M885DRAFT_112370 [Pelagophyceae sp. CCMP2097]
MRACKRCLDHYWTLGLTQSATEAEIKHAFLELAKTHDFNKGDASTFAKIAEAHEILTEKASKYDYDRGIENHSDGARAQPAQETPSDGVFAQPAQVHETPSGFKRPKAGGGPLDDFGEFGVQHHGGEYTDYSRNEPEEVPVETPEHYALKVRSSPACFCSSNLCQRYGRKGTRPEL